MNSNCKTEHFVTLFDNNFLPIGMCLHASLVKCGKPFHLWILCVDQLVEKHLQKLSLPYVSLMPLRELETEELLNVKDTRSCREYCWTLTSFAPEFVFNRKKSIDRVTYLDSDLFFFKTPNILLSEFEVSGKDVLITEHGYSPECDISNISGRFCVQFMVFKRTQGAYNVLRWWQSRCLEWCFARSEDGKYGDQKYLDDWPVRFSNEVHVLKETQNALAPWNVRVFSDQWGRDLIPAFYHFHGLRIVDADNVLLYSGYPVRGYAKHLYLEYLDELASSFDTLRKQSINIPLLPKKKERLEWLRHIKRSVLGRVRYSRIP